MEIKYGTRGSGKTTYLVKKASKSGIPIVISSSCQRDIIEKCAKELGIETPVTITKGEWLNSFNRNYGNHYGKVYIDELSIVLSEVVEATETSYTNIDYGKDMQKFSLYCGLKHKLNDLTNDLLKETNPNILLNILKAIKEVRDLIENIEYEYNHSSNIDLI